MFKHFVITQFNLRNFPLGIENREKWIHWTRERINLFNEYCLPSFLNQTNKNFIWLIYFDSNTPGEFDAFIDVLKAIEFIRINYADGFDHFMNKYVEDTKELAENTSWVIMSRCDNDDCLEKEAINAIQNNFIPRDEFMISLASGYTLNINEGTLSHYYYPMSPFISIVESNNKGRLTGIFYHIHTKWPALKMKIYKEIFGLNKKSAFLLDRPYWVQIVHGENVSNSAKRGFPVLKERSLQDYGLNKLTKKQSLFNIPQYYNYVLWKRYFKSIVVRAFGKC